MLTNKERHYKIRVTRQDTIGKQDIAITNLNKRKKKQLNVSNVFAA